MRKAPAASQARPEAHHCLLQCSLILSQIEVAQFFIATKVWPEEGMKEQQISRALGWFSIGLGLAELLAPRRIGKTIGLRNHTTLIRLFGIREIVSGVGILGQPRSAAWMRTRVAGDAIDLAALGVAFPAARSNKARLALAGSAVMGVTVADVLATRQLARRFPDHASGKIIRLTRSITINRPAEELYRFWRDFENLPRIMPHLKSVQMTPDGRSRWEACAPLGTKVEWEAEIVRDEPNQLIAWRSLEGASVENWGTVSFAPATGGRGTVVRVEMEYRPPGGIMGAAVARMFGKSPEQQVSSDLRPFKQLMETGEIATTEGQPAGRGRSISRRYDRGVKDLAESSVRP